MVVAGGSMAWLSAAEKRRHPTGGRADRRTVENLPKLGWTVEWLKFHQPAR